MRSLTFTVTDLLSPEVALSSWTFLIVTLTASRTTKFFGSASLVLSVSVLLSSESTKAIPLIEPEPEGEIFVISTVVLPGIKLALVITN